MSNPVSRVLSFKTVIYLRRISLYGSSRPSDYRSDKPILSALLRMGFTWHKALPQCRWALTPPFHPYLKIRRFISVALSLESPPPGFLRHPVLRSSDFPHQYIVLPRPFRLLGVYLSTIFYPCQAGEKSLPDLYIILTYRQIFHLVYF